MVYNSKFLGTFVEQNFTKEIFDNSCKNCNWYKNGICKFENWKNGIGFRILISLKLLYVYCLKK